MTNDLMQSADVAHVDPSEELWSATKDGVRAAGLLDFVRVLLLPISTLRKQRVAADIAKLVFLIIGIDFLLSLLLLPTFVSSVGKMGAATVGNSGAKISAVGAALIFSTVLNILVIILMTALFSAVLLIVRSRFNPARLVTVLMLSSAPLIAERVVRIMSSYATARSALKPLLPLSTILRLNGQAAAIVDYFTVFDVWTFALVYIGMVVAVRVRPLPAAVLVITLWGGLQAVFFRLHSLG